MIDGVGGGSIYLQSLQVGALQREVCWRYAVPPNWDGKSELPPDRFEDPPALWTSCLGRGFEGWQAREIAVLPLDMTLHATESTMWWFQLFLIFTPIPGVS